MENTIYDQQSLESFLRNPAAPSILHENSNYNLEQKELLLRNITFEVPITLKLYHLKVLSFEKCQFKNGFEIPKESEITAEQKELIFEQCHLEQINIFGSNHSLTIKINSVTKLSNIQLNGSIKSLEISDPLKQNTTIDKFEISSKQINDAPANISIKDISIKYIKSKNYNGFQLNLARTKCEYIDVTSTRNCNLSITNKCNIGHFRVSELGGEIALSNSTITEISIDGSDGTVSLEALWIDGIVANLLEIRNGVNAKEISFAGGNNIDLIAIGLANVEEFVIQESIINKILIPIEVFKFQIFKITGLSDMPLHINSLIFLNGIFNKGYKADKPTIILEDFTVTSINFFSFNNYANFFASEILYNKTTDEFLNQPLSDDYQYELQSNKILIPNSLGVSDIFQVISSDLGKINFIGCDFSAMNMTIKASKITEIFLSGTEMPNNLMGLPRDQQIGYAQLKKVFENRGDSVKSLDYLSLELNAHYEELKTIPKNKRSEEDRRNLFILRMNKWSNNFGTSYASWPFAFFIMIILFILHNLALGYKIAFTPGKREWNNLFEISSLFFEFLYPIHKADFISDAVNMPVTIGSRIVDFVSRLFSGYCIYQFIQVFRKYGKK